MFVRRRGEHVDRWGCQTRHLRRASVCGNGREVRRDDADAAVVAAVADDLLRIEVIETAMAKALAALDRDGRDDHAADQPLVAELAKLDAEVARLSEAIARGGSLESLLATLQDREKRRAHVRRPSPSSSVSGAPSGSTATMWSP